MDDIYQGVALNKSTAKHDQTLMIVLQSLEVRNLNLLFIFGIFYSLIISANICDILFRL